MAMPKRWEIRQPEEADAVPSAEMQAKSWRDTYIQAGNKKRNHEVNRTAHGFLLPQQLWRRRERFRHSTADMARFTSVAADRDGAIIGLLAGYRSRQSQGIGELYVDKEHQGSLLAMDMTEEFFDWATPDQPIELGVIDDNYRAQAFYKKMGFTVVEESRKPLLAYGIRFEHMFELEMIRPPEVETEPVSE